MCDSNQPFPTPINSQLCPRPMGYHFRPDPRSRSYLRPALKSFRRTLKSFRCALKSFRPAPPGVGVCMCVCMGLWVCKIFSGTHTNRLSLGPWASVDKIRRKLHCLTPFASNFDFTVSSIECVGSEEYLACILLSCTLLS